MNDKNLYEQYGKLQLRREILFSEVQQVEKIMAEVKRQIIMQEQDNRDVDSKKNQESLSKVSAKKILPGESKNGKHIPKD